MSHSFAQSITKLLFAVPLAVAALAASQPQGRAQSPGNDQPAATEGAKFERIRLSPPRLNKGMPLMQALKNRRSDRRFSTETLSLQCLSELLWAADGVNRENGHRTAPSAIARYPVDIYVVLREGLYLYEPRKHQLLPVRKGDFREQTGMQRFAHTAPVNLIYVADFDRFKGPGGFASRLTKEQMAEWAAIEAGCQVQNVYLYCASEGLGAVIRGALDKNALAKTMKLRPAQSIIAAQTVGYPG